MGCSRAQNRSWGDIYQARMLKRSYGRTSEVYGHDGVAVPAETLKLAGRQAGRLDGAG
jgi:hypothetical protein